MRQHLSNLPKTAVLVDTSDMDFEQSVQTVINIIRRKSMYKFVRAISLFYIYVFNRVKVTGKENIPTDGALIICANHHSVFDILLLLTVFKRRIIFMAKQELFKIPVMSFFLKRLNAISVDRSGMPISAVRGALKALKNGEQLGIFPEGTRYNSGDGSRRARRSCNVFVQVQSAHSSYSFGLQTQCQFFQSL